MSATRLYGVTLQNDLLQQYEDTVGTSPTLELWAGGGSVPASCAAATVGTLIASLTNATSNWRGNPSAGVSALAGTFSGVVGADGICTYYRLIKSGVCHEQGIITKALGLETSDDTDPDSNILTFTLTTGVDAGMAIAGVGVPEGATALTPTSTTVPMSLLSTAGVASGEMIFFGDVSGDMFMQENDVSVGMTITVADWTRIAPGQGV